MQRAATLPQVPASVGAALGVETDQRLLGELLLEKGAIEPQRLEMALARQAAMPGERLGAILVRLGLISEQTLLAALSAQLGVTVLDDADITARMTSIIQFHAEHSITPALSAKFNFFAFRELPDAERQGMPDAPDAEIPADGAGAAKARPVAIVARDVLDSGLLEYVQQMLCPGQPYTMYAVLPSATYQTLVDPTAPSRNYLPAHSMHNLPPRVILR